MIIHNYEMKFYDIKNPWFLNVINLEAIDLRY